MNILQIYQEHCLENGIPFSTCDSIKPYDDTTLFCPSGMQQFKHQFKDESFHDTFSNVQSCLRLNDLDEIGDGSHCLYFDMLGYFSFRERTVEQTIDFMTSFLNKLNMQPDYVTIHPDKIDDWSNYYTKHGFKIVSDVECVWSDGSIGGYCTEFYKNGIEIGNIVNPLGTCIDVGFGKERLEMIINGTTVSKTETLKTTIHKIIENGYVPSNVKQGYVLRKLLKKLYDCGESIDHQFFQEEIIRQSKIRDRYERLKSKFPDKDKHWWYDTHGIDISFL